MSTASPSLRGSIFAASFAPYSSPLDWCEENGDLPLVEFYNTVSNAAFIVLALVSFVKMDTYCKRIEPSFHAFRFLLAAVGIFSGFFHATLSLAGQLLDEWSILWINIYALACWCPDEWLRRGVSRATFKRRMLISTGLIMPLGCLVPAINAPILAIFSVAHIMSMTAEMRKTSSGEIKRVGKASIGIFSFAFICWINDMVLCDFWTRTFESAGFTYPQLHSLWHVGIAASAYLTGVTYSYIRAEQNKKKVAVRYFMGVVPWLE